MENDVRIAITTELIAELEKHSPKDKPDPILGLCRSLPRLKMPGTKTLDGYREKLLPIVFPEKAIGGNLKANDEADLRHLATAIVENAKGFITSDSAILRASVELESTFGLTVLSPSTFGQGFAVEFGSNPSTFVSTQNSTIERSSCSETDLPCVYKLLSSFHLTDQSVRNVVAGGTASAPRRLELVRSNDELVGFAAWDSPPATSSERSLHMYANESHVDAPLAIRNLMETACRDIGRQTVAIYLLKTQVHQHLVRSNAFSYGFHPVNDGAPRNPVLRKACLGRAVLPEQWDKLRAEIENAIGIKISGSISSDESQPITVTDAKGQQSSVNLLELEELLSPAIICSNDRPGVIFPILPSYAEELFHGGQQPSFLNHRSAILKPTKAYIGGNYGSVPEGGLAFFYESSKQGGRMSITAVARIRKRYAMPKEEAKSISSDRGVLSEKSIDLGSSSRLQTVTDIDSIMRFSNPIGLDMLREMGCADGANFVTSKVIKPAHCAALIRAGVPYLG